MTAELSELAPNLRDLRGKTVQATFFEAPTSERVVCLTRALVLLDDAGTIRRVDLPEQTNYDRFLHDAEHAHRLVRLPGIVLPGFVDLHVHAPQYPQLGRALDVSLEEWLQRYTFPLEERYADLGFAESCYSTLVRDLLATGTTTVVYFGTIHVPATTALARACLAHGQRALVGRVAMDHPGACPASYRDASDASALADTRVSMEQIQALPNNDGFVRPVLTPRFTPSCTGELLAGLGALAHETGVHVQTHCSESDWQHTHALERFGCSDVEALDAFGLVGRRSVLAHANFLSDADFERVAARGASVAHCPYSNAYFANAAFPLRAALAKGIRVGLGTDVSGGPSASMFESMRMAVLASRTLESGVDPALHAEKRGRPRSRVEMCTAFYLATAGGGAAIETPVGRFAPGFAFDAVQIDPDAPHGTIRLWDDRDDERVLQTILYTASRANVAGVWTNGIAVSSAQVSG